METTLTKDVQARLRGYFAKDPLHECGCLVTTDFELIPFENIADNPICMIVASPDIFNQMVEMLLDNKIMGWAHSHPHWAPYPSQTDLEFHQIPVNMIIYSVPEDRFMVYTPEDLTEIEELHDPSKLIHK